MKTADLTADEAERALKVLRAAGVICRSPGSAGATCRNVCYVLTGVPLPPRRCSHKQRQPSFADGASGTSFDALLSVWGIVVPRQKRRTRSLG